MGQNPKNINDLKLMVDMNLIAPMLGELADEIFDMWYKGLEENWYDKYDPIIYERTYAILKALVRTKLSYAGGYVSVSVFIDENIMNQYHPNSQGYLTGSEVVSLVEVTGMQLTNGVYRNPAEAYEETVNWLKTNYTKFAKDYIKKLK